MTDRGVRTLIPVGSNAKINLKYFMDSVLHKLLEVKIAKKQFVEPDKVWIHHDATFSYTAEIIQSDGQDLKENPGMTSKSFSGVHIK